MSRLSVPLFGLLIVLAVLGPSAAVFAQSVSKAKEGNAWLGSVVAIVLAIAVAIASFMSSRRGHQD